MTVSLNDGSTTLVLPEDLQWVNEFDWSPIQQGLEYSLSGALIIQEGVKLKGREITLYGGPDAAWITRADVKALYAMAQNPATVMTFTHADGRTFNVLFNRQKKPIDAREIYRVANPDDTHPYSVTIELLEVAE